MRVESNHQASGYRVTAGGAHHTAQRIRLFGWQGRTRTDIQLLNREPAYLWRTRQIWCNGNDSNDHLPGFNRVLYLL